MNGNNGMTLVKAHFLMSGDDVGYQNRCSCCNRLRFKLTPCPRCGLKVCIECGRYGGFLRTAGHKWLCRCCIKADYANKHRVRRIAR